jgi:endonuclease-3
MARESQAERRKRALRIVRRLARAYPDAACALRFQSPFELLVATILSAQCTDKVVNEVTPALFRRFPTPGDLASADPAAVEALVRRTGFFRQKTKSLQAAAADIVEKFDGQVPRTMEELTTLRGVARKTANVVLGNVFGVPGLTVDTHMIRINGRLGLTAHSDPVKIERDLQELIPRRDWTMYSHRVIHHGRVCCDARKPRCDVCPLRPDCPWPRKAAERPRSEPKASEDRSGKAAERPRSEPKASEDRSGRPHARSRAVR